jgi:uncharacterized membrane protein
MTEEQITDNDKLLAAVSYIFWPLAVIILLSETNKERPFQRYHAIQALGFGVAATAVYAVFGCFYGIIVAIASAIADFLGSILSCLTAPIWLIPVALAFWFAYRAYQGEKFEIPVLTEFMRGQGWL